MRTLFKYSLLYNLPFLNIWGFRSMRVLSLLKALWLTSAVWTIVSIFCLLFLTRSFHSHPASAYALALPCSLLLLPSSLLKRLIQQKPTSSIHPQTDTPKTLKIEEKSTHRLYPISEERTNVDQ